MWTNATFLIESIQGYLFTEIHIGEPAQLFTVVVSTMTPYIAVPSVFCNEESTACSHHKKYNATKSKTHTAFERDLTVQIDGSDASGYFSRDKFAVMHVPISERTPCSFKPFPHSLIRIVFSYTCPNCVQIANHEIPEQLFLEVTKFDSDAPDRPFDGVLGFAFRQKSMGQAAVTLDVMREEHQKTKRGNLNGFGIVAPKSHDATLIIGTSTRNLYVGPLNVIQLVKWSVQWSFPIQRITFPEGDEMPKKMKKNWMGIIEPAVNHLAGPEAIIEFINVEKLNAQYEDDGWYHVDCKYISTLPEIVFTINKIEYPISSERYILKVRATTMALWMKSVS